MTEFSVVAAAVLMVGALVAKTATGGLLAGLRAQLAEMATEERQSAGAEKKLQAQLGVMQTRELELKRDVKKLDIQLAKLQAELTGDETDDDGTEVGVGDAPGSDEPGSDEPGSDEPESDESEPRAGEEAEAGHRSPHLALVHDSP